MPSTSGLVYSSLAASHAGRLVCMLSWLVKPPGATTTSTYIKYEFSHVVITVFTSLLGTLCGFGSFCRVNRPVLLDPVAA